MNLLGNHPLAKDERGLLVSRIGTVFVRTATLVTLPGVHATQRMAYVDHLNGQRAAQGLPPLAAGQEDAEWAAAVDLIMDGQSILIRPDPANMDLAFEADQILQSLVSKRQIRFLYARHEAVQSAIRTRGEYWRISRVPQSPGEIARMLAAARIGIEGRPIYYYNMITGTRFLTLHEFAALAALDDAGLARHLAEIRAYAGRVNRHGSRELAFFGAGPGFGAADFAPHGFRDAAPGELRALHGRLVQAFREAVPPDLRDDNAAEPLWRSRMFSSLTAQPDETASDEVVRDLNPEFFMQIRWLPGGRIVDGELLFDSIFDELERAPHDRELHELCDERVKSFICNYIREFGNLEYINVGRLMPTLRRHVDSGAHRAYVVEVKHQGETHAFVRILRFQKWGIREHIESHKDLLQAIMEAEEYTDYIHDRRLGCWQLGMPVPPRIMTRRIPETYQGNNPRYHGARIWTTYFERDYVRGTATDKIPPARFAEEPFAIAFACVLGQTAVPNMLVGRTTTDGRVIFDDGDEILILDANGMPRRIIVADHAGTFTDCQPDCRRFAADYAQPVAKRWTLVANPEAFADAYLQAFADQFVHIQEEYRQRRRAFDTMFKHSRQEPGAFGWRWKQVLARLDATDVDDLIASMRGHLPPRPAVR